MWTLRARGADETAPFLFRLTAGQIKTIGRAPRADFVLDAPLVSRLQCRLSVMPAGDLEVCDLDSTNGTWVNGERVERAVMAEGDVLRIGRVELTLERDHQS